jgi:hypothetical protein
LALLIFFETVIKGNFSNSERMLMTASPSAHCREQYDKNLTLIAANHPHDAPYKQKLQEDKT